MKTTRNDDGLGLDRRLVPPATDRWSRRVARGRLGPAVLAAAIGTVLVATPVAAQVVEDTTTTTSDTTVPGATDDTTTTIGAPAAPTTTVDPFDAGTPVTTIEGDSSGRAEPKVEFSRTGRVKDIQGDGINLPADTGSISLIDGQGLEHFINTDITFSTTSSASAAMSEASFTTAVPATTQSGGTTSTTLDDAFDGYNALCIDLGDNTGSCTTDTSSEYIYNQLGEPPTADCAGRNLVFPVMTIADPDADLTVQRQVYVPSGDEFARWINSVTNTGGSTVTVRVAVANNLGSDSDTIVTGSSAGGAINTGVTWVGSMEDYSGGTSGDPRLGHVLAGGGASVGLSELVFVDGDDNPVWAYSLTLAPGETRSLVNFVTGSPAKATANAKAASLAAGSVTDQWACTTDVQRSQVANFAMGAPPTTTTTTSGPTTTTTPPTTAPPSTAAPAVEATGTLPYTGGGAELIPLGVAGMVAAGTGTAAAAVARRRSRRPRWLHRR